MVHVNDQAICRRSATRVENLAISIAETQRHTRVSRHVLNLGSNES
jgi:hypothetical protein